MKKPTKYEGSPADERADAKAARKAKITHKKWEGSPADKKADAKGSKRK